MRTLAWICGGFSAAVFAAVYLLSESALVSSGVCLAVFILLLVFRRFPRIRLFTAAAAVGFAVFAVHAGFTTSRAEKISGETLDLTAQVVSFPEIYSGYTRVTVKLTSDNAPKLKTLLYVNDSSANGLRPGERIAFTASLKDASVRYGEEYQYYNSRDIYLTANAKTETTLLPDRPKRFLYFPAYIGRAVTDAVDKVFPSDTRHYIKSLMIGDRSQLYEDTELYTAMKRTGIMHIVAVSGMHAVFLVGVLRIILGAGAASSVLGIAVVWMFAFSAGAPPSAIRAAFMQSLLILSTHIRRENDAPTSLLTVLALLLAINPYSAASVSLQLSFAAMAGMIMFTDRINTHLMPAAQSIGFRPLRTLAEYIAGVIAATLSVLIFTVPLCAVHFGYVSIVSPLTNILIMWVVSVCFIGGYAAAIAGMLFAPVGRAIAWAISWAVRYTFLVVRLLAKLPFAVVYTDNMLSIAWLIFVYAIVLLAIKTKWSTFGKTASVCVLTAASLAMMLFTVSHKYDRPDRAYISAIDVGQGQCIAVMAGDRTLMIDCGGHGTLSNAGETAGAFLQSHGRKGIDALVLTHLHSDHANGVEMLIEQTKIDKLILPADASDEDGMLDGILAQALKHSVEVEYISEDETRFFGDITLSLYAPGDTGDINERGIMMTVSIDDYDMLITGDVSKSVEKELMARYDLSGTELLIVGHHGSRYSSTGEFLQTVGGETAIISVGYNTYGHPTFEVLDRLDACGYNILRTDINGTVTIEVD